MMAWSEISFQNPIWLWLIIVPVLGFGLMFLKHRNWTPKVVFSNLNLLKKVPSGKAKWIWIPDLVMMLGIIALMLAMARPQSSRSWEEMEVEGVDIVMALDLSASMLARDFKPSRYESAKKLAIEFADGRVNDRMGVVVYSGESFTQCPITTDKSVVKNLIKDIELGWLEQGTAIGDGLATAVKRLKDSDAKSKVIILLTDGENNSGELAPTTAAELAKTFGIRVYTIGVGTKGEAESPYQMNPFTNEIMYKMMPVNIDESTLKQIAEITDGKYYRATDEAKLRAIYQEIDELEKTKISSTEYHKKTERFLPFAMFGLISILLAFTLQKVVFKTIF